MKRIKLICTTLLILGTSITSCEDLIDIEAPNFQMTTSTVFSKDETASAAVKGIYNQLYHNNTAFSNGWQNSITVLTGMSGGLISPRSITDPMYGPFARHDIITLDNPAATANLSLWSSAYNIIYLANSVVEGLENSTSVTETTRKSLTGQALFIRAFVYFYLVNIYGDVPLLLTTDYLVNTKATRTPATQIWRHIETDLQQAISLLDENTGYEDGERSQANIYAAMALLARVYLYMENWVKAEELSSQVIAQSEKYEILEDLNQVFLANSREAIWQISPVKGSSIYPTNTNEASIFIIYPRFGRAFGNIELKNEFISEFESSDKRKDNWVGVFEDRLYYPYKYKVRNIYGDIPEYSMVLRFSEQFLIRAEARAYQGKLVSAIEDLDRIRQRAGLSLISKLSPGIDQSALLDTIMSERKKEFFSEWGHRWFDLKRTHNAKIVFKDNPSWQDSDVFYPIPEEERMKNPNLSQNNGY